MNSNLIGLSKENDDVKMEIDLMKNQLNEINSIKFKISKTENEKENS